MNAPVDNLISERARTHGDFQQATVFVQSVKTFMRKAPNWHDMPPAMQESLDMLASKIGRILHGDPEAKEHWEDLEGYSRLVVQMLEKDGA